MKRKRTGWAAYTMMPGLAFIGRFILTSIGFARTAVAVRFRFSVGAEDSANMVFRRVSVCYGLCLPSGGPFRGRVKPDRPSGPETAA